ncbi:MAG TPA: hypothetical protein DD451_02485 [Candidatus Moranbacteria bacterium]|nr:hypothetical protein [Candidatus Moranbacteria bacterium]
MIVSQISGILERAIIGRNICCRIFSIKKQTINKDINNNNISMPSIPNTSIISPPPPNDFDKKNCQFK